MEVNMEVVSVESSNIQKLAYAEEQKILIITFLKTGARYLYFGVPEATFKELSTAESVGKAFRALILNKFKFINLEKL